MRLSVFRCASLWTSTMCTSNILSIAVPFSTPIIPLIYCSFYCLTPNMNASQRRLQRYFDNQTAKVVYKEESVGFKFSLIEAQIFPNQFPDQPTNIEPKALKYELVKNLQMRDGVNPRNNWTPDRDEAIKKGIQLVGQNQDLCATIFQSQGEYYVLAKNLMDCEPGMIMFTGFCQFRAKSLILAFYTAIQNKMLSGCVHSQYIKKIHANEKAFHESFKHNVRFTEKTTDMKHSLVNAELTKKTPTESQQVQYKVQSLTETHLQYEIIKELDMIGPELQNVWVPNRQGGIALAVDIIEDDPNKCALLTYEMGSWMLCVKDATKSQPSQAKTNFKRETIFLKTSQ